VIAKMMHKVLGLDILKIKHYNFLIGYSINIDIIAAWTRKGKIEC